MSTTERVTSRGQRDDFAIQSSVAYRLITLLELVSHREDPVGVREAARETGLDRSTVSRLFSQLELLDVIEQTEERGGYVIGPRWFAMAAAARARDTLWNAARPILEQVVARHNETCYLTVREDDGVVFREKVDCNQTIRYVVELGRRFPLTTGAAGTAILSALPREEQERILAAGWQRYTEGSVSDIESYRALLAEDRERGYSLSMGRWVAKGSGIAAPFFDANGECIGALTLSCPADRMGPAVRPAIAASMVEASRELSRRLGYVGGA